VPKKQQIRVSPERSGRRVRWTFEVSADVDAEKRPRAKKSAKKRKGATASAEPARKSARPQTQASPARTRAATTAVPVASPVPASPPAVESNPPPVAAPVMQATLPWHTTGRQLGMLAGIAVVVIATMAVPRSPSTSDLEPSSQRDTQQRARAADVSHPSPTTDAAAPRPLAAAAPPVVKPRGLTESAKKPTLMNATNRTAGSTRPTPPASRSANAAVAPARESPRETAAPEPKSATPTPTTGASLSPVTVTGCLEISTDGNDYRLADTEGAEAPKSRSWRTGFLRKRNAPVALIDAPDPLALKNSVGKRVAATGVLTSRELQVSSLRVVAASCN
jgi:hypothetical protein